MTAATDVAAVAPFAPTRVSGYDFGAPMPPGGWNGDGNSYGWLKHLGTDYGTAAGEPILAPLPGTVKFEAGVPGYGNKLTLTLANGFQWIFGHVAAGASGFAQGGQRIGTTGQNIGSARGAVTLVEIHDPQGHAVNPHTLMDPLFRGGATAARLFGAASGQLFAAGAATGHGTPPLLTGGGSTPDPLAGILTGLGAAVRGQTDAIAKAEAQLGADMQQAAKLANPATQILGLGRPFFFRLAFVALGVGMIGAGLLVYFKGDEIKQLPGKVAAAAGEVAAPEAAPAIAAASVSAGKSAKPKAPPLKQRLVEYGAPSTAGDNAGLNRRLTELGAPAAS